MKRAERRGLKRRSVELAVLERSKGHEARARAVDLSAVGMRYLKPAGTAAGGPEREVELELALPDDPAPLRVRGFIVDQGMVGDEQATSVLFAYDDDVDSDRLCRHLTGAHA